MSSQRQNFRGLTALLVGLVLAAAACGPGQTPVDDDSGRIVQRLLIDFDQSLVFRSSVLQLRMKGSERMVPQTAQVQFEGTAGGAPLTYSTTVLRPLDGFPRSKGDRGDVIVEIPVNAGLWDAISPSGQTAYNGDIRVELVDEIGTLAEGSLGGWTLQFATDATPTIGLVASNPNETYYSNQRIGVTGQNFLRPEEGTTWAVVDGTLTHEDTEIADKTVTGKRVPFEWTGSRQSGAFYVDPAVFGVRPGSFQGSLRFENELSTGETFPGGNQPSFSMSIGQPFLACLTTDPQGRCTEGTPAGSRGQRVSLQGRGFVPQAEDGAYVMLFRFSGVLTFDEGGELDITGENYVERPPDSVVDDGEAELAVWYEITEGGDLEGLGARPGLFQGTITPIFQDQYGEFLGVEYQGEFRVNPTKQMVYVKYLPGFSKGLEKYGIANVELDIRRRILEVTNRDYADMNVEFVDEPPTEFLEFATIEIGGVDPSGGGKFGYDNTCNVQSQKCKDTKNLFLGDYLGGINVNSQDEFNTPFGGVFIESFDFFSPTLNPDNDDASPSFDRVLKPFMAELGGTAVKGTEYPEGERSGQIREAIHMVGSVIGNTCSHEIGHSLGLSFFPRDLISPGEAFHNKIPCTNCMMDPGSERPFEERGELDGLGPAKFNERNYEYLVDILPLPQ